MFHEFFVAFANQLKTGLSTILPHLHQRIVEKGALRIKGIIPVSKFTIAGCGLLTGL